MWPWSAAALKEQLDRIERNQLRIAAALKILSEMEQPPVGVPASVQGRSAPRAPRRKLTEADVHFVGQSSARQATLRKPGPVMDPEGVLAPAPAPAPAQAPPPPEPPPLGSTAPERPAAPAFIQKAMHWNDSASTPQQLP